MRHNPSRPSARARRGLLVPLAIVAALLLGALGPASSAVAANYQYWSYWQLTNGTWTFSQQGPQQTVPADGSIEGWRWAIDDGSGTRTPRAKPTFEQLCGTTTATSGSKRVGVLVDFGREVDGDGTTPPPQPPLLAKCAVVPTAATGAEVLANVVTVRTDKSMICGLQGYPATGCGAEVATLTEAQKAPDTPVNLPTPTPISAPSAAPASSGTSATAVTVVAIGVAAVLIIVLLVMGARRRNRMTT